MSYGQGQNSLYTPPPRVRLDVLSQAWQLVREQMGTWVLATFIAMIPATILFGIYYAVVIAAVVSDPGRGQNLPTGLNLAAYPVSFLVMMLQYYFLAGLSHMGLKQLRGEAIAVGDIFTPRAGAGAAILAGLLTGLGVLFGTYACLIPGLLLSGLWMLTAPILANEEISGVDAMKKSFATLKPDMWNALGVMFVLQLVAQVGTFACLIGGLVSYPLLPLSLAILYRDFFPDPEATEPRAPIAPTILGGER